MTAEAKGRDLTIVGNSVSDLERTGQLSVGLDDR